MENIKENINLSEYTTLRIGGPARYFVAISNLDELRQAISFARERSLPFLILGRGANMLISDAGFPGLVIKNEIKGRKIISQDESRVVLEVAGGEDWPDLVSYTVSQKWYGLENLASIPGTVGAAPVQNIGAYGVELKDHCLSVTYIDLSDPELAVSAKAAADCRFAYRDSFFKQAGQGRYFILGVTLSLDRYFSPKIEYGAIKDFLVGKEITAENVYQAVVSIRSTKLPDPAVLASAGSFFKNIELSPAEFAPILEKYPEIKYFDNNGQIKIPTAWLIEQCGFKGFREGNVGVHVNQPLVLVNYGGATQTELWSLVQRIIDKVKDEFGLILEPEVNLIK